MQDAAEELELDQPPSSKNKIGKWERRQRRIAAASKAGAGPEPAKEAVEEDFLELVAEQREGLESQSVLPIKKRLKIRKDGSAQVLAPVSAFQLGVYKTSSGVEPRRADSTFSSPERTVQKPAPS